MYLFALPAEVVRSQTDTKIPPYKEGQNTFIDSIIRREIAMQYIQPSGIFNEISLSLGEEL